MAFVEEPADTICAFCLMTSAGVKMAHDTSSAMEDAAAWITGEGTMPLGCFAVDGLIPVRKDFVPSYVVKKAPAANISRLF